MVLYYQHLTPNCSSIAKLLFTLIAGQKRDGKVKTNSNTGSYRKLKPSDWTDMALCNQKESLLNCVFLSHPDFSQPLILSIDASLKGLGAVLPQIPAWRRKSMPHSFHQEDFEQFSEKNTQPTDLNS